MSDLDEELLARFAESGLAPDDVERQIELLRCPRHLRLDRPCTIGDGILALEESDHARLQALQREAAAGGRFTKFVPASGAATRMFDVLTAQRGRGGPAISWELLRERAKVDSRAAAALELLESADELALFEGLEIGRNHDLSALLEQLFGESGLRLQDRPKGLLPFHRENDGVRTPLEQHLAEAAATIRDAQGLCRLHFTVSPQHREAFKRRLGQVRESCERRCGARFEVDWSTQHPSTDTLALDASGRPALDASGRPLIRPGGHGALLTNLSELGGDLVYVKNIDNVQPEERRETTVYWKRSLAGLLVELQSEAHALIARLRRDPGDEIARRATRRFLAERFGQSAASGEEAASLIERLDRPLRVCGVVANTGEPGGGPFWVADDEGRGASAQIVESAQVDPDDPGQAALLGAATHFNPVDLVCALGDAEGRPYELERFVDDRAVIVTRKVVDGEELRVLERPGLWNGAMARWNTLFVEVPLATFSPVKSVLDLLRPEHRTTRPTRG